MIEGRRHSSHYPTTSAGCTSSPHSWPALGQWRRPVSQVHSGAQARVGVGELPRPLLPEMGAMPLAVTLPCTAETRPGSFSHYKGGGVTAVQSAPYDCSVAHTQCFLHQTWNRRHGRHWSPFPFPTAGCSGLGVNGFKRGLPS